jgi:hypothetical protein
MFNGAQKVASENCSLRFKFTGFDQSKENATNAWIV